MENECFCLNCCIAPAWFTDKVISKDIECEYNKESGKGKMLYECRFYDTQGRERILHTGDLITKDMIYQKQGGKNK